MKKNDKKGKMKIYGEICYKGEIYMKKIIKNTLFLGLVCSLFVTQVQATPAGGSLKDQKDKAQQELTSLQNQLKDSMAELYEIEAQMVSKGEEIIRATADLEEAKQKEEKQYEAMKCRIVAMYENGNNSMISTILESGSFADMLKTAENVRTMHEYDRKELQKFVETKEKITNLKATLESEQEQLEKLHAKAKTEKSNLASMVETQKSKVADIDAQIQEAARKAAEEAARREEERRRQQQAMQNQSVSSSSGSSNSGGGGSYSGTGDASVGQAIVAEARKYIGVPYVWGGTSFKGIDCSGLTQAAHKAVGISIPRVSKDQANAGKAISGLENALPGDVICYPGHVAIYIGNYKVIHAPTEGQTVKEASVYMSASQPITDIRRYW